MNNDDIKITIILRHYKKLLEKAIVDNDTTSIIYYRGVVEGLASAKNILGVSVESVARTFGEEDNEQ